MDLNESISCLDIDNDIIKILNDNNINTIEDVWKSKRIDLKKMGIKDNKINYISIKLQLLGLDFNKKIYKNDRR